MSMFDNYDNITPEYVPNNLNKSISTRERITLVNTPPITLVNVKGSIIGQSWTYGDTTSLNYSTNKVIKVEDDAIIYTEPGLDPNDVATASHLGQRAYNIVDLKSYECVGHNKESNKYIWRDDYNFTYPDVRQLTNRWQEVTLKIVNDIHDKTFKVEIKDFRRELIHTEEYEGVENLTVIIDKQLSDKLTRGVYYFIVTVYSSNTVHCIEEEMILVK